MKIKTIAVLSGLLIGFGTMQFNVAFAAESPAKPTRPKLYDPEADGSQQIATALKSAAAEQKRLILKFGANW